MHRPLLSTRQCTGQCSAQCSAVPIAQHRAVQCTVQCTVQCSTQGAHCSAQCTAQCSVRTAHCSAQGSAEGRSAKQKTFRSEKMPPPPAHIRYVYTDPASPTHQASECRTAHCSAQGSAQISRSAKQNTFCCRQRCHHHQRYQ